MIRFGPKAARRFKFLVLACSLLGTVVLGA